MLEKLVIYSGFLLYLYATSVALENGYWLPNIGVCGGNGDVGQKPELREKHSLVVLNIDRW